MYLPDELLQARHGATAFEDLGCYKMLTERRQGNERGCWAFRTGTDSQSVAFYHFSPCAFFQLRQNSMGALG